MNAPTNGLSTLAPMPGGLQSPVQAAAHDGLMVIKQRRVTIQKAMHDTMIQDVHYGIIPGTDKPALFKPGAEMLVSLFNLGASVVPTHISDDPSRVIPWKARKKVWFNGPAGRDCRYEETEGECTGFYEVLATATITGPDGRVLAASTGSCNSMENKYRDQSVWDTRNTILKMGSKRALVAGVLMATGASDMFTQDVEDDDTDGGSSHPSAGGSRPPAGTTQGGGAAWLSEAQNKAVFAKGKAAGINPEGINATIAGINAKGKQAGRGLIDDIFKGGAPANAIFAMFAPATATAKPAATPAASTQAGLPLDQSPDPEGPNG